MSANPPFGAVTDTTCGNCFGQGFDPDDGPDGRDCPSCRGTALDTCRDCGEPSPYLSSLSHCRKCSFDFAEYLDCAAITGTTPPTPAAAYEVVTHLRALAESRRQWLLWDARRQQLAAGGA